MGQVDELAKLLYGESVQKDIAAENPYLKGQSMFEGLGNSFVQAGGTGNFKLGEVALSTGIAGLLSGLMGGAGGRYQNTLTNRYNTTLEALGRGDESNSGGLPGSLFAKAKDSTNLFKLQKSIDLTKQAEAINGQVVLQKELAKDADARQIENQVRLEMIKNPRDADRIAQAYSKATGRTLNGAPAISDAMESVAGLGPAIGGVEGKIAAETDAVAQRFMDNGATPGAAYEAAGQITKSKRAELDRQYTRVEESIKAGEGLKSMVSQMRLAAENAGATGQMGTARQSLSAVGSLFSGSQEAKYSAGQQLKSFSTDIVKMSGEALKGPMSDKDIQIILSSGPSLDNTPATNKSILDRFEAAAIMQQKYGEFIRKQQANSVPVAEAEAAWSAIKKAVPYVIRDEATNRMKINPAWLTSEGSIGDPVMAATSLPAERIPIGGYSGGATREDALAELRRRGLL